MLGFIDIQITLVYILCILSTLLCVGYSLLKWNDSEEQPETGSSEPLEEE
jgi:hypothetical protein